MLTPKQEMFVKCIVFDGMNYSDAYRAAYNTEKMSDKTINEKASILKDNDKIRARIKELRGEMMNPFIMSAQERLELLTRIARGEEPEKGVEYRNGEKIELEFPASLRARREAIDTINKMTGEYVQKVDATVTYEDNLRKLIGEDEY